jgi:2-polyprenyl-3-methyl-5-hydroxy-6-metoxy-1,4-benzoquinol methylase
MRKYILNNPIIGDAKNFFNEYSVLKSNYSNGKHTKSIDGTGVDVSVGDYAAERIADYICKKFDYKVPATILDAGAGLGHLQSALTERGFSAYSIEGSRLVASQAVCDKNRYSVVDLCQLLTDTRMYKAFDLSTSFELIEHIHPEEEENFWTNLIYLSYFHLCSIHGDGSVRFVNGEVLIGPDPSARIHCNLKTEQQWKDYFDGRNIKYEILGHYPKSSPDQEEFRRETQLKQWNDWQSCSFWLLDFIEAK